MSDFIILSERVKELSRTEGTIDFSLDGAVNGFSSFSDTYSSGDPVFYAITDGTDYEVGSGIYGNDGTNGYIIRSSPFKSTHSDALVPFDPGVKEVYVTYPGKFSVFTASGLGSFEQPDGSGVAFWGSQNILDYDSAFIWDKTNNRLGISESAPQYSIHVGGTQQTSKVAASGFVVGNSGINFVGDDPSYSGGVQLEPFMRNGLNTETGTDGVFSLSGLVDQVLLFKRQTEGTVLAGPPSGCSSAEGCPETYPVFRGLVANDIPDLSAYYLIQKDDAYYAGMSSGIAFFHESGVIDTDSELVWDRSNDRLGVNKANPTVTLDVDGDAKISGQLLVGGNVTVTGNLDVQGDVTYIDSSTVTIWDKNLELASLSGAAQGGDSTIDDAGLIIKSTDGDKKWTWRDATDAWTTDEKIDISGIIFNDSSVISGAYQPGSGLELHNGLEFNIGNMFTVSADDAVTRNLHQADQLSISGISGISITSDKSGSLVSVTIDGGELSELVSYTSGIAEYASGIAEYGSGIAEYASGIAEYGSGIAEYASGVAEYGSGIAEYASGVAEYASGVGAYASGQVDALFATSYTSWTVSDGIGGSEAITNGITVNISGVSGIDTQYDVANRILKVGGAAISGWIDASGAVLESKINASGAVLESKIDASGAAISGWADSSFLTNSSSEFMHISGVSYYASGQVDSISPSTAGSGLVKVSNVFHTAGTGNFDAVQVGVGNNALVKVGWGNVDEAHSERSVLIGQRAGSGMLRMQNSVLVGFLAGALSSGDIAAHSGNNIFIGTNAGYASSGSEYSNFIGRYAGANTSGVTYSNALGRDSLKNSTTSDYNNAIGYAAGKDVQDSDYNEFIGYRAGESSAVVNRSVTIGYNAGYNLQEVDDSVYIGSLAGSNAASGNTNVCIGYSAGRNIEGDNNIYLGYYAGASSSGNDNIEIVTDGQTPTTILASNSNKIHIQNTIIGDTNVKKIAIGSISASNLTPDATVEVLPAQSTDVGVIVQGAAAQSADLQQWQDSSEVVKAKIDVDGEFQSEGMTSKNYKLHGDGYILDSNTARTLSDSDNGHVLMFNNSSPITVTVPAGLTLGFACTILQLGTGQITFSASSTTINNRSSHTKTAGQHSRVGLMHYSTNVYNLGGDTAT